MSTTVTGGTGTIFLNSEWVPDGVATVYDTVTATGSCNRNMYDRRTNAFDWTDAWCFDIQYTDEDKVVEI